MQDISTSHERKLSLRTQSGRLFHNFTSKLTVATNDFLSGSGP